jgi:predicted alpha/beta superfamily hydrolase
LDVEKLEIDAFRADKEDMKMTRTRVSKPQPRTRWWVVVGLMSLSLTSYAQLRQDVTFEFEVGNQGDILYLLGALPELGHNDMTRAIRMTPSGPGQWQVTVSLPVNRRFYYRYYFREDGMTNLAGFNAEPVSNYLYGDTIEGEADQDPVLRSPLRIEDQHGIESTHLGEFRPYRVVLPRGYDEQVTRRYPVLYLHDGQCAFTDDPVVLPDVWPLPGPWPALDPNAVNVACLMQADAIPELIIVAVDALSFDKRSRDYIPRGDRLEYPAGHIVQGAADDYARFLIEELKPAIDAEYRTLPDREHTATAGFSLGGLVSLYLGWEFPHVFSKVGSWSGSFWVGSLSERIMQEPKRPIRIYLDSGEDNYEDTLLLRDNLVGRAEEPYVVEGDLRYTYAIGQDHHPAHFLTRLPELIGFLFPIEENQADLPDEGSDG